MYSHRVPAATPGFLPDILRKRAPLQTLTVARQSVSVLSSGIIYDLRRARAAHAPSTVPRTDFDPSLPEVIENPFEHLARLREHPVAVNERLNIWMIAGHADVSAAAKAGRVLSSAHGVTMRSITARTVATTDNPDHDRLRRMLVPAFAPPAVRPMRKLLESLVDPAVDALVRGETVDVVDALCIPLPVSAIAVSLGVDRSRLADFRRWSQGLGMMFGIRTLPDLARIGSQTIPGAFALQRFLFAEMQRADGAGGDILSRLREGVANGELQLLEAVATALLLLFAGNETTTNLLGILLMKFARDPDLYDRVRADPGLIPAVIEEGVRWGCPVQWVGRTTVSPYSIGGTEIPERARVLLFYAGANRDPRRFANPDEFDLERGGAGHLGFGSGPHQCIGATLARLEVTVALQRIVERVKRLEIAGPYRWTKTTSFSGPAELPMRAVAA